MKFPVICFLFKSSPEIPLTDIKSPEIALSEHILLINAKKLLKIIYRIQSVLNNVNSPEIAENYVKYD